MYADVGVKLQGDGKALGDSPASAPIICRPSTRSLASSITSFIRVRLRAAAEGVLQGLKSLR